MCSKDWLRISREANELGGGPHDSSRLQWRHRCPAAAAPTASAVAAPTEGSDGAGGGSDEGGGGGGSDGGRLPHMTAASTQATAPFQLVVEDFVVLPISFAPAPARWP